jgi:uncharacterized damage-inducible protein DinB
MELIMDRANELAKDMYNSVFGNPWHGLSVQKILEDITEGQAFSEPVSNAHNICEIVLHLWAWTEEIISRLEGNVPAEPSVGDWPNAEIYEEEGWVQIKNIYFIAVEKLIEVIKIFPEENLDKSVGTIRDESLGTGISSEAMISGLIQHNAYHAGQIAILKKSLQKYK